MERERFKLDEPIWIFAANGALSTGQIKDISLTGAGIVADENLALATKAGETARVFIAGVGFVTATVVRQAGRFLAVHLNLPPCVERDLLIRKLFTAGLDATTVTASALSSTGALLMSVWSTNARRLRGRGRSCSHTGVASVFCTTKAVTGFAVSHSSTICPPS